MYCTIPLKTSCGDTVYPRLDDLTTTSRMEKIKSIGMTYFVAGGIPTPHPNHYREIGILALNMLHYVDQFNIETGLAINLRIGIHFHLDSVPSLTNTLQELMWARVLPELSETESGRMTCGVMTYVYAIF